MKPGCLVVVLAGLFIPGVISQGWESIRFTFLRYHEIPVTRQALVDGNYSLMAHNDDLNVDFYCYMDDPRVAIGVDSYGNIAGLRVSYIKEDLPKRGAEKNLTLPYSFSSNPLFQNGTFLGADVWFTDVLFTSPEQLRAGGRADTEGLIAEDVFLALEGEDSWVALPVNECDGPEQAFNKEGCYPGMGLHYFYNLQPCVDVQTVFGLYEGGNLVGVGIALLGWQNSSGHRNWFEDSPVTIFQYILPSIPDCLVQWVEDYGITALHFFFKDTPSDIAC